jgi:hypothetical protein
MTLLRTIRTPLALSRCPAPFALSLSKGLSSLPAPEEGEGFDRLSPNGSDVQPSSEISHTGY